MIGLTPLDYRVSAAFLGTLVLGFLSGEPVHAQAAKRDVLFLKGQAGTVSGTIQADSPENITIDVSGERQIVPIETIDQLRLADDPTGMAAVRASVQSGQFEQANTQLKSVQGPSRLITKQDIDYYQVLVTSRLALQGTGSVTDAARDVGTFIKSHPNSFRYYDACELMGDLAMSLGRFASAVKYYEKIGQAASETLAAHGQLLQGDAWLRQGDTASAAKLFRQTAQVDDVRMRQLSAIGLATCAAREGNPGEAIQQLETVIRNNDSADSALFARAYNALGLAYGIAGQKEAALDAYLHTHLLFYRDQDAHAEALYHLVTLWSDVNKPTESKLARQTLQSRFASTFWANQAQAP